jgi:predicted Zn-dependent protease with MMP-like domain/Tfp pilus assembly protein PilF
MSRADRLDALIERGFSALLDGELEVADRKLAEARRIDSKHPDVQLLDAALLRERGDDERALGVYERLMKEYPDDPIAYINAAQIHVDNLDLDAALVAADRALELVDEEEDLVAAVLAKVAAHALRGEERDHDAAREALGELSTSAIEDPISILDVASAHLSVGDTAQAKLWYQRVKDDEELGADAWHGIGMASEDADDRAGMIEAFQEVRRRDAAAPQAPWHISLDEMDRIAAAALAELPDSVRERLANVPILIDDLPSEEMVADGVDPRLLGLFQGTPMPEESSVGGTASLTNIHLFQRNLERHAQNRDDLLEEIRITVLHETAHFFGLDEDDLADLGLD